MPGLKSTLWNQLGAVQTGQNHNSIYDGFVEAFYVGAAGSGSQELNGRVFDVAFYANGVAAARPKFDTRAPGAKKFTDGLSKVWAVSGGAKIH